jgi:hypothetical protein
MRPRKRGRSGAFRAVGGVVLALVLPVACASPGDVLVEVVGAPSSSVDALSVEAYLADGEGPVRRRALGPADGLPQRFLVRIGDETRAAGAFRLVVHGYRDDALVASGDVRVAPDATTATVELSEACRTVACPRLQGCAPDRAACDGACAEDADCAGLVGCAEGASCDEGGADGRRACVGSGADLDGDGALDARCPLGRSNLDCDDTERLAGLGQPDRCGALRDHDCDGLLDELQLCPGCDSAELVLGPARVIPLGAPVRAVAGPRPALDGDVLFAATPTEVVLVAISSDGTAEVLGREPANDPRDLFLVGPLLAAATRDGLALFEVTAEPSFRRLGAPLPVPPTEPVALAAVAVARGTAWVSGDGVALAAVDVDDPANPRFLGMRRGPGASVLAPFAGGVLANGAAPGAPPLRSFLAEPQSAPGEPIEVPAPAEAPVTAIAVRRAREGVERGAVGLAVADGRLGAVEQLPGGTFERRDEAGLEGAVAGLWLDEALAVAVRRDARVLVLPRREAPGTFGPPTLDAPLPEVDAVTDVDFSSGPGNAPRLVLGSTDAVVLVELRCIG